MHIRKILSLVASTNIAFQTPPRERYHQFQPIRIFSKQLESQDGLNHEAGPPPHAFTSVHVLAPPPNLTGPLHVGQGLNLVATDAHLRYWELLGHDVCVSFGSDHSGMALESQIDAIPGMESQGAPQIANKRCTQISQQHRDTLDKLGIGYTFDHFTLDEKSKRLTLEALETLKSRGLITECMYPTLARISDIIEPIAPTKVVFKSTTRVSYELNLDLLGTCATILYPEYFFGTVAVGVPHKVPIPDGTSHLELPLGLKVPLVPIDGDECRLLMPGHDLQDWILCSKLGMEPPIFLNENACIKQDFALAGYTLEEATKEIIKFLEPSGTADVQTPIYACDGSQVIWVPMKQLILDVPKLTKAPLDLLDSGKLTLEPPHRHVQLKEALRDAKPWCISRYGWWGIPIDDKRVLDTWFTSALWPLITHVEISNCQRLLYTCHDILHNWVMRMLVLCLALKENIPLDRVIFHGMVLDDHLKKMSKSKGNTIELDELHERAREFLIERKANVQAAASTLVRLQLLRMCSKGDVAHQMPSLDSVWSFLHKVQEMDRYIGIRAAKYNIRAHYDLPPSTPKLTGVQEILSEHFNTLGSRIGPLIQDFEFGKALDHLRSLAMAISEYAIPLDRLEDNEETFGWLCGWYLNLQRAMMPFCFDFIFGMKPSLNVAYTNDLYTWPRFTNRNSSRRFDLFQRVIQQLRKQAMDSSNDNITSIHVEIPHEIYDALDGMNPYLSELVKLTYNRKVEIISTPGTPVPGPEISDLPKV
ncbi:bifunctional Rossmann-like alpha-beta-alpha sandwich fold/Valyl-Leucyl-Isoleucyl-tRNA synthetase [Babesia duncani]|uniref:valine--tRNA ligase n=1 Tax=Babesia duncani TaxID=323732 RepID=A0AAD9PKJ9_9APIC|nr:bifunctional Rossmann-like alpha-beta-alpha sandwich fold/Valyl-Leucyl-Isoleucyl-tRNA synthetase [Babesia duncani]